MFLIQKGCATISHFLAPPCKYSYYILFVCFLRIDLLPFAQKLGEILLKVVPAAQTLQWDSEQRPDPARVFGIFISR
jgi:hypothetical protein